MYSVAAATIYRFIVGALLALFIVGCASAPLLPDKTQSYFNDLEPPASPLVRLAQSQAGSGVALLADPEEALQVRLGLAELAQATLDLQYYLWQGDDSGLSLSHEVWLQLIAECACVFCSMIFITQAGTQLIKR